MGGHARVVPGVKRTDGPIAQEFQHMSQTVKGVISRSKKAPTEVVDVVIPDPGARDVVVAIKACGVCHTDLAYREGGINDEYPFLLGHEAAGVVESVGSDVTHVEVGDFVVLNWRAVCGQCRACKRGRPWYCFDTFNASVPMTLTDGTELTPALGIGAFIEKTLIHELQCTKVDSEADPAVAGLLGCGVMAGIGAAINTGAVNRDDTVAVIGCGGVGMTAVALLSATSPAKVVAIDPDPAKREAALRNGAALAFDPNAPDALKAIGKACQMNIAGAVDFVGAESSSTLAVNLVRRTGQVVIVGLFGGEATWALPLIPIKAITIQGSYVGNLRETQELLDLVRTRKIAPIPVTTMPLAKANEALSDLHKGKLVGRAVLTP